MHPRIVHCLLLAGFLIGLPVSGAIAADGVVADGVSVSLEYTMFLADGTEMESNVGQKPLTFVQGSHHLVPGLEKAIEGMTAGQKKHVEVPAEQAYGEYDPSLQLRVPRQKVPPTVKVGDVLARPSDRQPLKVVEITNDTVVMDANHRLAGKNLVFDIKILKIEPAPKP
jgi:FKBP-type peptidyl-prolyl cis-trans isomerase 2